ncbi:DNA polymerase delta small subunit Cdc1 [Cystobasidiomycetes sp. EMM_F5]
MEVDEPEASTSTAGQRTRLTAKYDALDSLSNTFCVDKGKAGSNAFKNQYASVYFSRLMALKKRVKDNADRRWKDVGAIDGVRPSLRACADNNGTSVRRNPQVGKSQRVLDITQGHLCYVIGTIYMEMRLKPNILEELAREQHVQPPPPRPKFLSDDDEVMLEDESGRVRLIGKIIEERKFPLVTGVIAAILGAETQSGDFEVVDICFAGMAPQPSSSAAPKRDATEEDAYVALISGLELGINDAAADFRVGLLAEWLLGESGSEEEIQQARQVTRVILAGNSMCQPNRTQVNESTSTSDKKPKKTYGYDSTVYSAAPTAHLDNFLCELLPSVDVELMSGEKDPNGSTVPQQPLHHALLPNAAKYSGFYRRTNPCWLEVAGTSFLGTSGQNIDDIFKYLDSHDRISMSCSTLEWSHMAPTAPDTLFCYPFHNRDPFILTQTPDVYFIGNQPQYESRLVASEADENVRSRVVLVPKFYETGQIVLLNCRSLECKVVEFGSL